MVGVTVLNDLFAELQRVFSDGREILLRVLVPAYVHKEIPESRATR